MKNPKHIPTPALSELEAQVQLRKEKMHAEGHDLQIEQAESRVASSADDVPCIADAVKPAIAVFSGLQARMETFYADMRAKIEKAEQTMPCEFHPKELREIDFDRTCSISRNAQFVAVYQTCAVCAGIEEAARQRRFWSRRGVPERVLAATFGNFEATTDTQQAAVAKARAWARRRGNFLLICGSTGAGKGHLASACLKAQGDGLWIEQVNMLADLRASYGTNTTKDLVEKWQDCEMFVLDEFGLSGGGKDEEPLLYQVLADRYDKRRPTIITSNLDRAEMRVQIGFRLLDRIREDVEEIICNWPSHRTGK